MDVARPDIKRKKKFRRAIWIVLGLILVPAALIGVNQLKPAAPTVDRAPLYIGAVKRGGMVRNVRGIGTLVAEDTLFVPAMTDGRVERIHIRPGTAVTPDSTIVVLTNPELEQQTLAAEFEVKMGEARLADLRVQLDSATLTQKAELARLESEQSDARLRSDRDTKLFHEGLLNELNYKLSKSSADQLDKRVAIERERLQIRGASVDAQLAVQRSEIDRLRATHELKKRQIASLQVRAGVSGVLQELPVQIGQQLAAGTVIAKVAQPERLKAELKIPETQIKDVTLGQKAEIDTRNGIIPGRVYRIDPAAREGTVVVDVKLEGALPQGARPDLSVDGVIELERLTDVVNVARPVSGQPGARISIFKLAQDGREANLVQVLFGRASVDTIEVKEGLSPGDQVILSDMSTWDQYDRIQLR